MRANISATSVLGRIGSQSASSIAAVSSRMGLMLTNSPPAVRIFLCQSLMSWSPTPSLLTCPFLGGIPPNKTISCVCLAIVGHEVTCPVTAPVADLRGGIRDAVRRSRNVLEHAGLRLGQRLATAPTLHEAAALRVGKRMGRLALGDLIDDLRGSGDEVPQVTKRERDLMKSRRSQGKRHALRRGYTPRA